MTHRLILHTFPTVVLMLGMGATFMPDAALAQAMKPPQAPEPSGYPTWAEFPPPPVNVPTAAEIRTRVLALEGVGVDLQRTVDAIQWELRDPERFASSATARVDPVLGAPVTRGLDPVEVEAFANRLRQRATPPPVAE